MKATVRTLKAKITPAQRNRILANYRFYNLHRKDLHHLESMERLELIKKHMEEQ